MSIKIMIAQEKALCSRIKENQLMQKLVQDSAKRNSYSPVTELMQQFTGISTSKS